MSITVQSKSETIPSQEKVSTDSLKLETLSAEFRAADCGRPCMQRKPRPLPTEPSVNPHEPFVTISWGLRGWYPVVMWWNPDLDGFWEPWRAHPDSFVTQEAAVPVGKAWAESEGLEFL